MSGTGVLVVVEVQAVRDAERFREYQLGAREQIARFGGSVFARGGAMLEGTPGFGNLMVQAWPSEQAFRDWQESDAYRPLRALRLSCADLRMAVLPRA